MAAAAAGARGVDASQHRIAAVGDCGGNGDLLIKATLHAISNVWLVSPLA